MSIVAGELIWRYSQVFSAVNSTNGGRMTAMPIPTAIKNNIFPDVPQSERTAGSIRWRKIFIHVANDADLTLIDCYVFVETRTPGDDSVIFVPGTQTDVEADIVDANYYGAGILNTNIIATATEMSVLTEGVALNIFRAGMKVRISNRATISDTGTEEFVTIVGTPTYVGNVCTFTFTPAVTNPYTATVTKVSSMYYAGNIAASVSDWVASSVGSGTYDDVTYPLLLDHISTVEDNWTLTFTSSTAFGVVGAATGSVGTGTKSSNFAPNNPNYSKPYFTLNFSGWALTWASGDTVTFTTHPASVPIWYRRQVPAGAGSLSGNSFVVAVQGESE